MKDYIERETLIKEGWYLERQVYGNGYAAIETKQLKDVPTADVRPVVRAHFGKHTSPFTALCSECGASMNMHWNFCPNCGADMRGERDGGV